MATLRELKTRIGSVASSEKITGAMKMISSAKVRINEQALRKILPFKNQISSVMGHLLSTGMDFKSPLIEQREVGRIGIVVFGSDDGLCGAYNINIFKFLLKYIRKIYSEAGQGVKIEFYPVGKKMVNIITKFAATDPNYSVHLSPDVNSKMEGSIVGDFTRTLQDKFLSKELDRVDVVYMQFQSMSRQRARGEQLFPVSADVLIGDVGAAQDDKLYIFEPDPNRIFNEVLPMFVLSTMQEITIENRASEQASRVLAMQSANDNAKKLAEELQLEYNKLRQQSITTELLDIIGGQVER